MPFRRDNDVAGHAKFAHDSATPRSAGKLGFQMTAEITSLHHLPSLESGEAMELVEDLLRAAVHGEEQRPGHDLCGRS